MTEEEALELVENTAPLATNAKDFGSAIVRVIYADLESRTCKNCKFWNGKPLGPFYCPELNYWVEPVNFGCSEFKRKQDEQ